MSYENNDLIAAIWDIVKEIRADVRILRRHHNVLGGTPILEFGEVCQMLKQSERQVRRYRESGQLVGFSFNRRRLYTLTEVEEFIASVERETKRHEHKESSTTNQTQ